MHVKRKKPLAAFGHVKAVWVNISGDKRIAVAVGITSRRLGINMLARPVMGRAINPLRRAPIAIPNRCRVPDMWVVTSGQFVPT